MIRVEIENFQSIGTATLDLQGFVVVTGKTNMGKSALVRALGAVLFGDITGEHVIREGTDYTKVSISTPDHTLTWERKGTSSITIDGVLHTRSAREHSQLIEPYGFRTVDTGTMTVRPQLAFQHDPLFLLPESPAVVAKTMQVVARVDVLAHAVKNVKAEYKRIKTTLSLRERDAETVLKELGRYQDLTRLKTLYEETRNVVNLSTGTLDTLETMLQKLQRYCRNTLSGIRLPEVPVAPVDTFSQQIAALKRYIALNRVVCTPDFTTLPEGVKVDDVLRTIHRLERLVTLGEKQHASEDKLHRIHDKQKLLAREQARLERLLVVCPLCKHAFCQEEADGKTAKNRH